MSNSFDKIEDEMKSFKDEKIILSVSKLEICLSFFIQISLGSSKSSLFMIFKVLVLIQKIFST